MPPGRDQVRAMERLARILAVLDSAGTGGSTTTERLLAVGQYGGQAAPQDQLSLDLRNLRKQGWQIDNLAGVGEPGRYRMVRGDNRLRVRLTGKQIAALQRAVLLSRRADLARRLGVDEATLAAGVGSEVVPTRGRRALSLSLQAVQLRSRLRFSYKGSPRLVHPGSVRFQDYQWYLSGIEEGSETLKHFVVDDLGDPCLDAPGSASPVPEIHEIALHPLRWRVDAPTRVVLRTTLDHEPDVTRWLEKPDVRERRSPTNPGDTAVDLTYTVTHRRAFRARLHVLGQRVSIVHGDEIHAELIAELRLIAGL